MEMIFPKSLSLTRDLNRAYAGWNLENLQLVAKGRARWFSPWVTRLQNDETSFFSIGVHDSRFFSIADTWFFQQNVFPSFQCLHRPLEVKRIWQLK